MNLKSDSIDALLLPMYQKMFLIRQYEKRIYFLFLEGKMPGTIHQSMGQEATAVGMLFGLDHDDYMVSTHRPAAHSLAKGVPLKDMMAEMFAKKAGCCKAKGGAMHTGDIRVGAIPAIAIVGGNIPIAAGIGLSLKMQKRGKVVVSFFGDGATNEGAFHEGLNGAAIWDLPVIFACENNLYGASTPIHMTCKLPNLADRAAAYGIPGETVDGNDVLAVYEAGQRAIKHAREGGGPTLLELKTYRLCGHSRNDACGYRGKDEEQAWKEKDPILLARNRLLSDDIVGEAELDEIERNILAEIDEAVTYAQACDDPVPEDALTDVYYEGGN